MVGSVRKHLSAVLIGILYFSDASFSYAQSATVPSAADPSRALLQNPQKQPDFNTVESPSLENKPAPSNAPDGSEQAFFIFKDLRFEGMTAYQPQQFLDLYEADKGQRISVARLFEILNSVQQRYLDDGYGLSRVVMPTQDIAGGTVVFQVIEGYAAELVLDGDFPSSPVISDAVRKIEAMKPLNTKKLERLLLIMNDLPGLNVSALLGPTQTPQPVLGGIRLTLKRNFERTQSFGLSVNNQGSRFSGPAQIIGNARQASLVSNYDEVSASIVTAIPVVEMRYLALKYQRPAFGVSGLIVSADLVLGRTQPGLSLDQLDVKGRSQSLKLAFSYPLIRQREETLKISGSFEARNADTDLLNSEIYDDRLRILGLGGTYNYADSYNGLNAFEVNLFKGINALGVRRTGSDRLSREQGESDFTKFTASVGRVQNLGSGFDLFGIVQGQYSYDPLLASEEFGFGGGQTGRGYDPSEITGDRGLSGTLELRYNALVAPYNFALQPYGFFDMGKVWNIDSGSQNKISAASAGAGMRVATQNGWSGDLNFAVPLTRQADNPPKYANGESPRFLFSLNKSF